MNIRKHPGSIIRFWFLKDVPVVCVLYFVDDVWLSRLGCSDWKFASSNPMDSRVGPLSKAIEFLGLNVFKQCS